ncbi:MAG: NAD-dependent DNA ligase LigA [Alphaproteobacteria bacterium]|nr:NAD-dependent DNA ligase LigA [Alphaproteobacteria bacterium]
MMNTNETPIYYLNLANTILAMPESEIEIDLLIDAITYFQQEYYLKNAPAIDDARFDQLFNLLLRWEQHHPSGIRPHSPSQRVGIHLSQNFQQSQAHLVPMLSLENSYDAHDLIDFDKKAKELCEVAQIEYTIEPKYDGVSVSLVYENDILVRAVTRGDGIEGEDITQSICTIKSVPLKIPLQKYGYQQLELRGEVLMFKKSFEAYNMYLEDLGLPLLANPRNAAAGSLRIKDSSEVARRNLDAFFYHISYLQANASGSPHILKTQLESLEFIQNLGFKSSFIFLKTCPNIQEVITSVLNWEQTRDHYDFEIDGLVIKINNLLYQEKMGMTSHHPRWATAYKFKARQAITVIKDVEFQIGKTGAITPVAKLEPVNLSGVTISSISIHNADYIKEKDIRIGDTVIIERAGDVIPQIVRVDTSARNGLQHDIIFPDSCPNCHQPTFKQPDEAILRCTNLDCSVQVIARLVHFASKNALDISSLGEANIQKFYQEGFLKNIPDIFRLPYGAIENMDGFGIKSVNKLKQAIEKSKSQPLHRIIYGLCIRFIGEATAKTLAQKIHHILDLTQKSIEELQTYDDIGLKTAQTLHEYFSNPLHISMIHELEHLGLSLKNINNVSSTILGNLQGQSFLFTGTLTRCKRSEAEALVEQQGGVILQTVSSKLNFLVVGNDAGSKLEKAKKMNTIKIINEDEFLNLIQ